MSNAGHAAGSGGRVNAPDSSARLRTELFVTDLDVSVDWYVRVLGFAVDRGDEDYVSLRCGDVVLGLGPDDGPVGIDLRFSQHGPGAAP